VSFDTLFCFPFLFPARQNCRNLQSPHYCDTCKKIDIFTFWVSKLLYLKKVLERKRTEIGYFPPRCAFASFSLSLSVCVCVCVFLSLSLSLIEKKSTESRDLHSFVRRLATGFEKKNLYIYMYLCFMIRK
jgi:hypothetical protein